MAKIYKYKVTFTSGETKEFECKYSPDKISMRHRAFSASYWLRVEENDFYITYRDVEKFELVGTTGEDTVDEICNEISHSRGVYILFSVGYEIFLISCVFVLIIVFLNYFNITFSPDIEIAILFGIIFLYSIIRVVFLNKKISQEMSEIRKEKKL